MTASLGFGAGEGWGYLLRGIFGLGIRGWRVSPMIPLKGA